MNTTSESLLRRLVDHRDSTAWDRFVALYVPLIFAWGRQSGLQPADASDLVQEVLAIVYRRMQTFRYDPARSFRGWLRAVTINRFRQLIRRRRNREFTQSDTCLDDVVDQQSLESSWDLGYQFELVKRAMTLLRTDFAEKTWAALQDWVLNQTPAEQAARIHGVSVWTLYSARTRLFARIKASLEGLLD